MFSAKVTRCFPLQGPGARLWDMEQHKRLVLFYWIRMEMDLNIIPTHGTQVGEIILFL